MVLNIDPKLKAYLIKHNILTQFISRTLSYKKDFLDSNPKVTDIEHSFIMRNTPEGYDFWYNHQQQLIKFKKHYKCQKEPQSILRRITAKFLRLMNLNKPVV